MQSSVNVIQAATRYRALPILIAGLAKERGYRVRLSKRLEFAIDQKNREIIVPSMRAIGTDEDAEMLEGGLDHELMHDRETRTPKLSEGILHRLWNTIEDPRGEIGWFEVFPGSRRNIDRTLEILAQRGCFGVPSAEQPADVLLAFLLYELRAGEVGQIRFCAKVRTPTAELARVMFGPLADEALQIAQTVVRHERGKQGSAKALYAARAILTLFQNPEARNQPNSSTSKQPPPPQEVSAEPGGEPSAGNQGNSQEAPSKSEHGAEKSTSGNEAGATEGAEPNEGTGAQGKQIGGRSEQGTGEARPTPDQAKAARAVASTEPEALGEFGLGLEDVIRQAGRFAPAGEATIEPGRFVDCRSESGAGDQLAELNRNASRRVALGLRLQLEDLLQSYGRVERRYARSGRFDPRRSVQVACGNLRAFRRQTETEALNTALMVLADCSGSMSRYQRMDITNAAALAVCETLEQLDVPYSLAAFSAAVLLFHDFGDSWQRTLARYAVMPRGGTRMAEAVFHGVTQLLQRDEERRILLIITDGVPRDWGLLEASIHEALALGIETRCVLISPSESVVERFAELGCQPAIATTAQGIPGAVFSTLASSL